MHNFGWTKVYLLFSPSVSEIGGRDWANRFEEKFHRVLNLRGEDGFPLLPLTTIEVKLDRNRSSRNSDRRWKSDLPFGDRTNPENSWGYFIDVWLGLDYGRIRESEMIFVESQSSVVGTDAVPVKCSLVGRRHRPDNVNCSGITFMTLDAFIMVAKKCYSSYAGCASACPLPLSILLPPRSSVTERTGIAMENTWLDGDEFRTMFWLVSVLYIILNSFFKTASREIFTPTDDWSCRFVKSN